MERRVRIVPQTFCPPLPIKTEAFLFVGEEGGGGDDDSGEVGAVGLADVSVKPEPRNPLATVSHSHERAPT